MSFLYLNRTENKVHYDIISIRKDGLECIVSYKNDVTKDTEEKKQFTTKYMSIPQVYQYIGTVLDFLHMDVDTIPYDSIDVQITMYPTVAVKANDPSAKYTILLALYNWLIM